MENADALDLSKENIQPLKKGRNTAQLGLALQAQTDTALHQMLSKKQEWYEMQIRTYEGSDPLELWCDYISWVEQSFPKHGPEGNLSTLLTKCFQAFKDEERYKNDIRFVGLWIKYIEMQSDSKRAELYHLLSTQGIGLRCAEFYRSWAYEYECVNEWKHAEQIFKRGFGQMAQPAEELHASYERFLAAYAFAQRNVNNESPEEVAENHFQGDQRLPMAALKPIGKKSAAPIVRVGTNVRSQLPGVLPAVQGSSGRSTSSSRTFGVRGNNAGPVSVYQERGETDPEVYAPQNIASAVPIPQLLNKENIVNAGPWTGQGLGSRKHHAVAVPHSAVPRQPGFEVHRDEDANVASVSEMRTHGALVPNALKPRKALEDGFQDAIAIFEEPNPYTKAMYRKNEVYAGGKELQLEELHALDYFRKKAEKDRNMRETLMHNPPNNLFEDPPTITTYMKSLDQQQAQQKDGRMPTPPNNLFEDPPTVTTYMKSLAQQQAQQKDGRMHTPPNNLFEDPPTVTTFMKSLAQQQAQQKDGPMHTPPNNLFEDPPTVTTFMKSLAQQQAQHNDGRQSKMMEIGNNQMCDSPATLNDIQHAPRDAAAPYGYRGMNLKQNHETAYRHVPPAMNVSSHDVSSLKTFHQAQPSSAVANPSGPAIGAQFGSDLTHLQAPHSEQRLQPSNQSMHNQSMTLHTKLAMHEVNNLWSSPSIEKPAVSGANFPVPSSAGFQIMRDDSLPAPLIENSPVRTEMPSSPGLFKPMNNTTVHHLVDDSLHVPGVIPVADETTVHTQPSRLFNVEQRMEAFPAVPANNFVNSPPVNLFEDPPILTSYMKSQNGFQVYQQPPYSSGNQLAEAPRKKFQVFCDEDDVRANPQSSAEKGDLSSSAHTSGSGTSVQKIAKEKENIHKFPQADIELMEECGVAPVPQIVVTGAQVPTNHYETSGFPFSHQPQHQTVVSGQHHLHDPMPSGLPGANHHAMQEPMEDDAVIASAPKYGINMSETGNTEAFFFPKVDASSTPFQDPLKKHRSNRSPIDFNSSLYRVEQTRPFDSDDDLVQGSQSPDTPKTVPPIKLFRIKNNEDQLSAILETSKEKYSSVQSSACNRSSIASAATNSRYGMYTTQRHSIVPQPNLNVNNESSEAVSQEGQSHAPNSQQMSEISMRLAKGDVNPFDSRLLEYFLSQMRFPLPHHQDGYFALNGAVPAKRNNALNLNGEVFNIAKTLGEGAYAKVLKGVHTITHQEVALKVQKPSCRWEYYICREIQHRLSDQNLASFFMHTDKIFVYNNGSVIVTDLLPFGTLLNLVNKVVARTKRPMTEMQALFMVDQLISAVIALHKCKIIHGDLKPDNVLIRSIPSPNRDPCIQLIDFGRSIDMTLMPSGTTFDTVVMTDTFTCIEMRTGRPWTYQTDLYGLANSAHCLIFGDYMKVQESRSTGRWTIQSRYPRNLNADFWNTFFDTLLNVESCDALPDLETLQADAQTCMSSHLLLQISALGSILMER